MYLKFKQVFISFHLLLPVITKRSRLDGMDYGCLTPRFLLIE